MSDPLKMPAEVRAVYDAIEEPVKSNLLKIRSLIYQVAAEHTEIGNLQECLKWGEPSYLTSESGSGTTIRINRDKKRPGGYALYVNCQTSLVEEFRNLYPEQLTFGGNRAVLLSSDDALPEEAIKHCIALALTYHSRKKA